MRKLTLSLAAIAMVAVTANAGKNVVPAPVEPVPVPVALPLGLYLGGGLTYAHSKCKCADLNLEKGSIPTRKADTYGFNLKAGYQIIDKYLAIEAKYFYTPWGDKDKTAKHYGLYLKPSYPVTKNVDLYALVGYGRTDCETLPKAENDFAWGLGAEYNLNERISGKKKGWGVYVEYLRPLDKSGSKKLQLDVVNAGIVYNF